MQKPHPATFPTQLAVNYIKIHGCTPQVVMLNPFGGIGHSALAAKQCGIRKFIGFDIDRKYVGLANEIVKCDKHQVMLIGRQGGR